MSKRWRFPIAAQLLLTAAACLAFAGAAAVLLVAQTARRAAFAEADRNVAERLEHIARASFPLTPGVLDRLQSLTQDHYVLLTDDATVTTFPDGVARIPPDVADPRTSFGVWRAVEYTRLGRAETIDGKSYRPSMITLEPNSPSAPGLLVAWTPDDAWQAGLGAAVGPAWRAAALVGAALALVAIGLAHAYARRLRRLETQTRAIMAGDFAPRPVGGLPDEIGTLGFALNVMAAKLEALLAEDRAAERMRLLQQVSGGLVHEVRNAVAGARLALQLHELDPGAESEAVPTALRQLAAVEETLSRFLKADGELPWNPAPMSLSECAASAVAAAQPRAQRIGVRLEFAPTPLPEIDADAALVRHALANLVGNALDAAGPDGSVTVQLDSDGGMQRVLVVDTGSGPDPTVAARLGEPFATAKPAGVGLGLTVVRAVAERAGGAFAWRRRPDGRTEFSFALPDRLG